MASKTKKILDRLFELAEGNIRNGFEMYEIGRQAGLSPEETKNAVDSLLASKFIEGDDRKFYLTQSGITNSAESLTTNGPISGGPVPSGCT